MARFGAKGGKGKGKGKFFAVTRGSDDESGSDDDDRAGGAGGGPGYDDDDVPAGATVAPDRPTGAAKRRAPRAAREEEEEEDEPSSSSSDDDDDDDDDKEDDATSADDDDDAPSPPKKKQKADAADAAGPSSAPPARKRKSGGRRRKPGDASAFVDVMAAVDEEEEEESEGDDDGFVADDRDAVAEAAAAADARLAARRVDGAAHATNVEEMERIAAEYRARTKASRAAEAAAAAAAAGGVAARRPPTHADPKLWLVATRTGKEREAVVCLMQKAVDRAAAGAPLGITAALAHDHLKGYVYVEAHKEAHVVDATRGLRTVYGSKAPKLVPLGEMGAALAVAPAPRARVERGAWVRVRAGAYRGDLARVLDGDPAAGRALIQLVPRLEWAGAPPRAAGERPPPRGFSLAEARAAGAYVGTDKDRRTGRTVYVLRDKADMRFLDGYLIKDVAVKSVVILDAVPALDEVQKFAAAATAAASDRDARDRADDDDDDDAPAASTAPDLVDLLAAGGAPGAGAGGAASASAFVKGDKVVVARGDLAGLHGRVVGAAPDGRPLVKPVGEFEDVDPQPVDAGDLAKFFAAGDHVKVIAGAHAGATGLVVRVDGAVVSVFADAAREQIAVFARDLAESAEVASGVDALGEYELHDGVALDGGVVGVVVALGGGAARVLTSAGTPDAPDVRSCRLPDIRRRLPARGGVAQDRDGNPVAPGDLVTLHAGARTAGATATVKLAWRGHLFVHCRDVAEHGGFLCVRGRQTTLKGGAAGAAAARGGGGGGAPLPLKSPAPHRAAFAPPSAHGVLASPARTAFGGGAAAPGPGFAPRSAAAPVAGTGRALAPNAALVGRTLKPAKGPYRGYAGRVVSATETHVRMELEARAKTVTVALADLRAEDVGGAFAARAGGGGGGGGGGGLPSAGAPGAYGALDPGRTPLHPGAGGATPMHAWGGAGGATPLHNAWGGAGGATPLHPAGGATPGGAWGGATPSWAPPPAAPTPGVVAAAAAPPPAAGAPAATPVWGAAPTPGWTPGATPGYTPAASGFTPAHALASTPSLGGGDGAGGGGGAGPPPPAPPRGGAVLVRGAVVRVRGGGLAAVVAPATGATVEIADVAPGPDGALARVPGGGTRYVAVDAVAPERPAKGDAVVVVEGRDAGRAGELIGLHASDGVVRLEGGADQIKVVEAGALAKRVAV